MAKKMAPLEVGLIDEGQFLKELNEELMASIKELLGYKKKHGKDLTIGAKAILQARITLKLEETDDGMVSIRTDIKRQLPARPPRVTTAMEDVEQDDTPTLFVRKTGSGADDPRQAVLTTKEGELVDPSTGEIKKK